MDLIKSMPIFSRKIFLLFLNTVFLFLFSFFISSNLVQQPSYIPRNNLHVTSNSNNCHGVHKFSNYASKCEYVKSHSDCKAKGYINYIEIFYCTCGKYPGIGYIVLLLWLVVLFYVLGNTTAEYFCSSLESLSSVLKLSPTIAGTTLLPLGNGANDVFSSVISFTRSGDGGVGLNSVLGGAFFISCFVVGVISLAISERRVRVDQLSFVRDVLFFMFCLSCLLAITIIGRINLWFAICFALLYFIYIGIVSVMQLVYRKNESVVDSDELVGSMESRVPLLRYVDEEKGSDGNENHDGGMRVPGMEESCCTPRSSCHWLSSFLRVLELPLYLPRRLTIPVVCEEKWSKAYAISSVTLSPILLAFLWNTCGGNSSAKTSITTYLISALIGVILGILVLFLTKKSSPPKRFLFPWLVGGFLMSIVWTYIVADELVSLLVAFGNILRINPSILGLTVLAWGNSLGDLVSNLAMALKEGPDGAQVAMSGCYAGPLFNTLVGLGISLVLASWNVYPSSYVIPMNPDVYETIGFLIVALLWALVILPRRGMRLDKALGSGLLATYLCFLCIRIVKGFGLVNLGGSF